MAALDQEALYQNLKKRRVCRFCLSVEQTKLTNIYMRDTRIKTSAPLPIQIMAIASIEVNTINTTIKLLPLDEVLKEIGLTSVYWKRHGLAEALFVPANSVTKCGVLID